jgi:tRNA A37 threonylcarbamoyladenosine dehydratase
MNRQLPALEPDLGRAKVDALRGRIALINPDCRVSAIEEHVTLENLAELLAAEQDWVLDCIDNFRIKAAMIAFCRRRRQSIITAGGAGGQRDATRVRVGDLRKTEQDPLLARTRRLLRRDYGFPLNPKRRFNVPCVWSDEPQTAPPDSCDVGVEGSLNCAGFGACMPVTATFGLVAAGYVINRIVGGD